MSTNKSIQLCFSAAALAMVVAGCATQPPQPVNVETIEEVTATVEGVDGNSRVVTLRGTDGDSIAMQVSPSVRNFAQVRTGDRVVVRYYTGLAAELRRRGDGSGETEEPVTTTALGRAPEGDRPAGVVGTKTHRTVRITNVNKRNHIVTFYGSDGISRSMPIRTPQGREFIRKLKVGDEVDVTYTEAVAISVEAAT
jgi:WD40 repeat protein